MKKVLHTTSSWFETEPTELSKKNHLHWYEYEIKRFKNEKIKLIEEEKQFIHSKSCIIALDGRIPNSIIRKKINAQNVKRE